MSTNTPAPAAREPGVYAVCDLDASGPWEPAEWDGHAWLTIGYPLALSDADLAAVGERIEPPPADAPELAPTARRGGWGGSVMGSRSYYWWVRRSDRAGWSPAERVEGEWEVAGIASERPEEGVAVLTGVGPRLAMPDDSED